MDRLWSGVDRAADEKASSVARVAAVAAADLEALIGEASPDADPLQMGRTWKYLGDARYAGSRRTDGGLLEAARVAYECAESFLRTAGDEVQLAKLHYNLANVLYLLGGGGLSDGGVDRGLLRDARARYGQALGVFRRAEPGIVVTIKRALLSLELIIRRWQAEEAG